MIINYNIEYYYDISINDMLLHPNKLPDINNNDIELIKPIVSLINIPSFMIPCDIIKYFMVYLDNITSIHIVKHNNYYNELYMAIIQLKSINITKQFISDYHGKMLTSLEPTLCLLYPIKSIKLADASGGMISSNIKLNDNNDSNMFVIDDICVVCLESIDKIESNSFTTYCNHTFHISCISRLEGPQCPVCRFQHDSTSLSECMECGWHGDITTDNRDLWACLVCGYIGCGSSTNSHIQLHYQQTLHTYAINTDDSRVWDFAGDGYVHRLVISQSSEDEIDNVSSSPNSVPCKRNNKLVEISNPNNISSERSQIAPLTNQQEEFIIHNKLESQAYQYNQLLRWQLQRNRNLYETRLYRVREFALREGKESNKYNEKTWAKSIIQSLKIEKNKIIKQNELVKQRLNKVNNEIEILKQFYNNITINIQDYKTQIEQAQINLQIAEKTYRETIPQLERKVQLLMEKLDS